MCSQAKIGWSVAQPSTLQRARGDTPELTIVIAADSPEQAQELWDNLCLMMGWKRA